PTARSPGWWVFCFCTRVGPRAMTHTSGVSFDDSAAPSAFRDGEEARAPRRLNHLRVLESESIHILREAAAEFARPVMLYSIGKDSSVMLRLAQKAFFPG